MQIGVNKQDMFRVSLAAPRTSRTTRKVRRHLPTQGSTRRLGPIAAVWKNRHRRARRCQVAHVRLTVTDSCWITCGHVVKNIEAGSVLSARVLGTTEGQPWSGNVISQAQAHWILMSRSLDVNIKPEHLPREVAYDVSALTLAFHQSPTCLPNSSFNLDFAPTRAQT